MDDMYQSTISYAKPLDIRYGVDVFVVGAGPAGLAAAVTAANEGASVCLIESQACFGGMATAGMLPVFMTFGDGQHFLAAGFGQSVYDAVTAAGGTLYNEKILSIPTEPLKRIFDEFVVESNCDYLLQTQLVDTIVEDGRIGYAICHNKDGLFAVQADVFIDCTGDGDLAAAAGAAFEKGDVDGRMMPATLCSRWAGIDWERAVSPDKLDVVELLEKAFADKIFTVEDRHHTGMAQTGENLANANMGHIFGVDGTDAKSLTKALLAGRKYLPEYELFYNRYVKGFETAELVASADLMGIRESRRIIGDYRLCADDYSARRKFSDQIGGYCYEIDIHPPDPGQDAYEQSMQQYHSSRYALGEYYGIPYRCLLVKGLQNLLVAGRCISADTVMQSSVRTMPGCFITGQAAGMAAALAAQSHELPRQINVRILQDRLEKIGGFIGQRQSDPC